jgi:hypothetical protein
VQKISINLLHLLERKKESLSDEFVKEVIKEGERKAKKIAEEKMQKVNKVIF